MKLFCCGNKIVVPEEMSQDVIITGHCLLSHAGANKTYETLKDYFTGDLSKHRTKSILEKCEICQVFEKKNVSYGVTPEIRIGTEPFELVHSDFVGLYPTKNYTLPFDRSSFYIATLIDSYSRVVYVEITEDISSSFLAERLLPSWFSLYKPMKILVTDQGASYMSKRFSDFLRSYEIVHRPTSGYNPRGNGKAERINNTINIILRIYKNGSKQELKRRIETSLNVGHHSVLRYSPAQILKQASVFNPLNVPTEIEENKVLERTRKAVLENNRLANTKRKSFTFLPNSYVLVKVQNLTKIDPPYSGPFKVVQSSATGSRILVDENTRVVWHHVRNVHPFSRESEQDVIDSRLRLESLNN